MDDPRRRDVTARMAAHAHGDAQPNDKKAATDHRVSRRTANRWRHEGPPEIRDAQRFLYQSANPFRYRATLAAAAKQRAVSGLTDSEVVERIHELLPMEKEVEGRDNGNDTRRGIGLLDRALEKDRDAALNEELSALYREAASRGMTEKDVFG